MNDKLNGLVKEVPNLIRGGWFPMIMLGVVIVGLGFVLWEVAIKDAANDANIATMQKDIAKIAEKQENFAKACVKVLLRKFEAPLP